MNKIGSVSAAMVAYDRGDLRLINHFLKVYGFAKTIGEEENLPPEIMEILEIAALTHDIGIRVSEEKLRLLAQASTSRSRGRRLPAKCWPIWVIRRPSSSGSAG